MKKVIIVGAGIVGLVSAIKLKHHGYDVTIVEKNKNIGGKQNQIKKDGFTFDMFPTMIIMPEVYDEVFKYVGKDPNHYFTKTQLKSSYNVYFSKANKIEVSTDYDHLSKHLDEMSENEIQTLLNTLNNQHKHTLGVKEHFLEKTFETISGIFKPKAQGKYVKKKSSSDFNSYDTDFDLSEQLKKLLNFHSLFLGSSPYLGHSSASFTPKVKALNNLWFIKGGIGSYIHGLEKLMQEMEIKVLTNTKVDEIFITKGQAKGVVIGEDIFCADIVINGTDFPYAMKNLIKNEKHRPHFTNKKLEKAEYSSSAFLIHLGLDIKLNHLNVHNLSLSSDFEGNINDIANGSLPKSPSMFIYVPSKFDSSFAPINHEALTILVPVPNLMKFKQPWDEKLTQHFRQEVLKRITSENIIENLISHIVSETIFTPIDWERHVNAHYGSIFGLSLTLHQLENFKPQSKSKSIQRLYHPGSSNHREGDIPSALKSTQLCIEEILKNDPNGDSNACSIYASQYENA